MNDKIVEVERVFNAPVSLVWRAITEKELMKQWYFDMAEFKATVGFSFEFIGGPEDGVKYKHVCEVTEVIPEKKLTYSWKYDGYEGCSYVTFELSDENGNTRLKLTHTGLDTFPVIPDFAFQNFEAGWNDLVNSYLKNFLETYKN